MNPPGSNRLDWKLLKRVSRSFYLTLCLLPGAVRESIALAYLAARLSDTQADGAHSAAEKELLERQDEVRNAVQASPDRALIEKVWQTIQEGQRWDQVRFPGPPLTAEERDRYTYLVAGCVGEFWTEICAAKIPDFSRQPREQMLRWGVDFGKGLQLVNILRDRQADAAAGRVYIREPEVPATVDQAAVSLGFGQNYASALRNRRLRAACFLPLFLAQETLALLRTAPNRTAVKVPRWRVYALLGKAFFA